MAIGIILLTLLPALVSCAGKGNIRLLEDEVAEALKTCSNHNDTNPTNGSNNRQKRSTNTPRIDDNTKQELNNQYGHERRNSSNFHEPIQGINGTDHGNGGYEMGNREEMATSMNKSIADDISIRNTENITTAVNKASAGDIIIANDTGLNRTRRNDPLLDRPDSDQCLSQCVFANLQVVDSRGIPREAELWNIVQSSVTSQQSRAALRDQIRACFQELQSEAEDNGCSYSNKLERCLMLRFSDRKSKSHGAPKKTQN